ncbi:anaerobic ribonucleoside-triphosphate reductase [Viridibacterium curvum]|uniref:Anaerobic ribonucleoside-triphosphate reductase n=1 Tax=Viridibacterium curvum TaxID=1101404 RepID=A0ABP9QIK0_9RHOO
MNELHDCTLPAHILQANTPILLRDEERTRCEVWTRVMGYHRPVASFNVGKQGEHNERAFFAEPAGN